MATPMPLSGALRLVDYWAIVYKRTWKGGVITSFVTPFFYILAMGVLLGDFVTADPAQLDGAPSYLAFIAPGMVAVQAMTIAISETTYPVMGMVKWQRIYYSMIASPLSVGEIVLAQLGFVLVRVLFSCGVFLAVLAPFGVFESVGGTLAALPVQLLIGLAFATPVFAFAAGLDNESAFALIFRLGMIPLTLFSGTFFPIGNLGPVLEAVARVTPLWQGVDLTRMLVLGDVDWVWAAVHVVYLAALAAVGWWLTVRRLTRRLVK
ncbi:ABC transporter permease [Nocardioides sp. CER19]|uniref:ABC transporter permease n=1 Tax=Nocardioides sp. CER19 TaxID=3038538 RepID=UPI00244975E0|nr:ABC transporter permease [Nocardioides sp. CER19]MDH2415854.1 ABC transporter permease [Nocardioides sp. CER19]